MRIKNGFRAAYPFCLLILSTLPPLITSGCAFADPPTLAAIGVPGALTRGSITYKPDTPVHATVTPRFDEKAPPPQTLTYGVKYQGGNGATVTANLMTPTALKASGGKAPAVILLHGLGGRKEDVGLLGIALSKQGYVSLAIDIAGHGERPLIDGKPVSLLGLEETRTVIGQTVADLHAAVDYLASRPDVDSNRIGLIGVSLGGIIGGVFVGDEPRVKSVALWSAGGDWARLMTASAHPFARKFQKPELTAETIHRTLADVDPLTNIGACRAPMLFLYGDKDTIVPTACIEELYNAAHEPKKRVIYPGSHVPDPFGMVGETIKWFGATLAGSPSLAGASSK